MGLWELVSLETDSHGKNIGEYFEREVGIEIKRVKYQKVPDYHYEKINLCKIVNKALGKSQKRKLVVYGSGAYHHFTYGLCKHADRISKDYAYIHFDHHSDSGYSINANINCADFVGNLLEDTNASIALFIGSKPPPHIPHLSITEKQLRKKKLKQSLEKLPEDVYLSFDLDVMSFSAILTAFNQGTLKPRKLMKCISMIKETKHIIGADVLGYANPDNKGPGRKLYARIVESLLEV